MFSIEDPRTLAPDRVVPLAVAVLQWPVSQRASHLFSGQRVYRLRPSAGSTPAASILGSGEDVSSLFVQEISTNTREISSVGEPSWPGGNTIENALLHFTEGQDGGLAHEFLQAFDAKHFAVRIEHLEH